MSETLTIIDADSGELAVTEVNNLRWQWPIEGAGYRREDVTIEPITRPYPRLLIGSAADPLKLTLHLLVRLAGRGLTERIEDLLWTMDPDRGEFTLKHETSGGNTRLLDLVRDSYTINEDDLVNNAEWVHVEVTCQAANPLWYDASPTLASGQFNGASAVDVTLANARVPAFLNITVSGDVATPKFGVGSDYFEWSYTLSGDDVAVFEFDPTSDDFGVRLNGGSSDLSGYLTSGSGILQAPAGGGTLQLTSLSGDAMATVQLTKLYKVLF